MHDNDHNGHQHTAPQVNNGTAYLVGILLNTAYAVTEIVLGFALKSMALVADGWHNISDVAGLIVAFLAFHLAKRKASSDFTYGYKKTTILAALANAVILLVTVGMLSVETYHRLLHPAPVPGIPIAIISGFGIVVNAATALLFFRDKEQDLNTRGAYLHMLYDAIVSAGVVVSGITIRYTGLNWLDPLMSAIILLVILGGTWKLLTDSLKMALDAVPAHINKKQVEDHIKSMEGVQRVWHTHIWPMSTTETALTTHVQLDPSLTITEQFKLVEHIRHQLLHLNIHHATIELEAPGSAEEE